MIELELTPERENRFRNETQLEPVRSYWVDLELFTSLYNQLAHPNAILAGHWRKRAVSKIVAKPFVVNP